MLRKFIYSEKSENIYFDVVKNLKSNIAIIFLHGIAGSRRSWSKLYDRLSSDSSLYFIDLLGYGFSAKPNITYTLENHIAALKVFIYREVKEKNIIFIGHSLGSIIALGYTSLYPEIIKKTILVSLPYYNSMDEAKYFISKTSRFTFIFSNNLRTKILCTLMCSVFGTISRRFVPYFLKDLPKEIAEDTLRHSYNSYISTLINVLYKQDFTHYINADITDKLLLVHGTNDKTVPQENIVELANKHSIPLYLKENQDHSFPLFDSKPIIQIIEQELK